MLSKHLDDKGYIVFNNHKNAGNTLNRIYKFFGYGEKNEGLMSNNEVNDLVSEAGLEIIKTYHISVLPFSEGRTILPIFLISPIEKLLSRCFFLKKYGRNLIFVCQHYKV